MLNIHVTMIYYLCFWKFLCNDYEHNDLYDPSLFAIFKADTVLLRNNLIFWLDYDVITVDKSNCLFHVTYSCLC